MNCMIFIFLLDVIYLLHKKYWQTVNTVNLLKFWMHKEFYKNFILSLIFEKKQKL